MSNSTQVSNPLGDMATTMAQGMSGPSQNPISFDPSLLLNAVGASSPSKDGTAATSIQSNSGTNPPSDGDRLRSQAADIVSKARDVQTSALGQAPPQMQRPKYSPLETAIAAAVGGFLNSASPFTSEGTKALNAYMGVKEDAAKTDYENEVAKHTQALQAAQQGYRMAMDQAAPLQQQANFSDENDAASDRLDKQQRFQKQMQEEQANSSIHEEQLKDMHDRLSRQETQDATTHLQQQKLLQSKLVDVLSQTAAGRALLAAQAGVSLGSDPKEIVQMARIAAQSTPAEVAQRAKNHLKLEEARRKPLLPPSGG